MLSILYYAPEDTLPKPLPSTEDIEWSVPEGGRNHCPLRRVVRVSQNYMVKYGWLVEPIEGENMLYVHEKTTRIRIPRVYAIYCEKGRDWRGIDRTCTFIVMEYIDGQSLAAVWGKTLDYEGKTSVITQLRDAFDELRSLAPPSPAYFGSIHNRQLRDGMFLTEEKGIRSSNGPFQTEDELTEALIQKMESAEYGEFPADMAAYYRRVVPRVLRSGDGRPVFSHSDLQTKNVMLQPDGKVVIVDWATAGWYPVYWEYAVAIFGCGCPWKDDFHAWIPKILDEYPNEYLWLANIRRFLLYPD